MPKDKILRGRKAFREIFRNSFRIFTDITDIIVKPSSEVKFAVIAKKKNIPLSTHRNYTKRILKEIFRSNILNQLKQNYTLVFVPKKDFVKLKLEKDYQNIQSEIIHALEDKGIINENSRNIEKTSL